MGSSSKTPLETNAERVFEDLRAAIEAGEYPPGERLRTEALAERFGTSRTPVREALMLLEGAGLVAIEPRRGAVVRSFDPADLVDLYEVRAILEARAAQLAALRISPEALDQLDAICAQAEGVADDPEVLISANETFHRIVVEAAGSPRLVQALRAVTGIPRPFKTVFWTDASERARSLAAHREIAAGLRSGSAERAESAMRLHVLNARDFLIEVMDERG
jgi:DNA-binding GntR family transcriptional regulator